MSAHQVIDGLLDYICLLVVLTFHEFAHAWMAWKCGDDTARLQGRVTLNPLAHMDLVGTVVLPLLMIFLNASGSSLGRFLIGWGKPVPVMIGNFRNRRRDDTLVALAGPGMNLLLAAALMVLARAFSMAGLAEIVGVISRMAVISLMLCFFNLLPIPPLDGSHFMKNLIRMREETYMRLSQLGIVLVIVVIQIPFVMRLVYLAIAFTYVAMKRMVGLG